MRTIFHRDGTVTYWSVYEQAMVRRIRPAQISGREWATFSTRERMRLSGHGVQHLPKLGYGAGLRGISICGRWRRWSTGDHALLHHLADVAAREGRGREFCRWCLGGRMRGGQS